MVDSEGGRGRGNTRTQASFAKVFLSLLMGATAVMGFSNPASACAWDNETYLAEAKSLPCVLDVLVGRYPKHTREYFDARIRAADAALSWVPLWTAPLDTKGVALMRLGRFSEARTVMDRRAEADPEAYASHANLGTLLTFTGSYEAALKHVDKALAVEPDAHFGRERYHRLLLVFLQRVAADSNASMEGDFLGPDLTSEQLFQGSEKRFRDGGGDESVFDALVAMIAVYGADEVSHVYFALANQLALRGQRRLAWTAYRRARDLRHPRSVEIGKRMTQIEILLGSGRGGGSGVRDDDQYGGGGYQGIEVAYALAVQDAKLARKGYEAWERKQVLAGLPVWQEDGLEAIYARQRAVVPRCASPGVVRGLPETGSVDGGLLDAGRR